MADQKRRNPAAKPSITRHPLFPAVVVLWFGALFGLASMAIRPELIESIVLATGIDHVIPMARPPLGTTTRILLALMATGFGCVLGAVVARLFAKPQPAAITRRRREAAPVEAAVTEEASPVTLFGRARSVETRENDPEAAYALDTDDLIDDEPPVAVRRRQLAISEDVAEEFEDRAPLPGDLPILKVADLGLSSFDEEFEPEPWVRRADKREATLEADVEAPASAPTRPSLFETYVRKDKDAAPGFEMLPPADVTSVEQETAPVRTMADAPASVEAALPDATKPESAAKPIQPAPFAFERGAGAANAAERIMAAPLEDLSHVELLERLALAIERRRTAALQTAPAAESVAAPVEMPAAFRPLPTNAGLDDDSLPGTVPPRRFSLGALPDAPSDALPQVADDVSLDAGYSSLLSVSKASNAVTQGVSGPKSVLPFPASPEGIPARAFDAPQGRAPTTDQTEQALRAALATLQRISGAA